MRFDFHLHTNRSPDGVHDIKHMVKRAKKKGLDGIAITDHNKLFPHTHAKKLTKQYGILVMPGAEIGKMTLGKHILAINITSLPKSDNVYDILDHIKQQNGLSIAPHPYSKNGYKNYDTLPFDAVERINGANKICNLRFWNSSKKPEVANSDAHASYMLGHTYTLINHAYTIDDVIEKIKKRQCKPAGKVVPSYTLIYCGFGIATRHLSNIMRPTQNIPMPYEDTLSAYD